MKTVLDLGGVDMVIYPYNFEGISLFMKNMCANLARQTDGEGYGAWNE